MTFQNNLAYALGQNAIWQPSYYVGTFSEYDMNAIRRRVRERCAGSELANLTLRPGEPAGGGRRGWTDTARECAGRQGIGGTLTRLVTTARRVIIAVTE